MIQCEDNVQYLRIGTGGVLVNKTLWGANLIQNGLYKIDLELKQVKFVAEFPTKSENLGIFVHPVREKERLFFIPHDEDEEHLVSYDLEKEQFEKIDVKQGKMEKYGVGIVKEGIVYLFPAKGERIVKVEVTEKKVFYQHKVIEDLKKFLGGKVNLMFWNHYLYGENVYLPIYEKNVVVGYNLHTEQYAFYQINDGSDIGFISCAGKGEQLYLLDCRGSIYSFNLLTKNTEKLLSLRDETLYPYISIHIYKNDEIWLVPCEKDEIVIYNITTREINFQNITLEAYRVCKDENTEAVKNGYKFSQVFCEDNMLWLYPSATNLLISINMETRNMEGFPVLLPKERVSSLNNFLKKIDEKNEMDIEHSGCGKKIWGNVFVQL